MFPPYHFNYLLSNFGLIITWFFSTCLYSRKEPNSCRFQGRFSSLSALFFLVICTYNCEKMPWKKQKSFLETSLEPRKDNFRAEMHLRSDGILYVFRVTKMYLCRKEVFSAALVRLFSAIPTFQKVQNRNKTQMLQMEFCSQALVCYMS